MGKREYLVNQLELKINSFKVDSRRHKNFYRRLRYSVFVLTSISTLLAGLGLSLKVSDYSSIINLAIVFVSAAVGVITSIEGIRKPAELWIHERTTYYALMDLKREVEFKLDENSSLELVEKYFFKMQDILGASGQNWNRKIASIQQDHNIKSEAPNDVRQIVHP